LTKKTYQNSWFNFFHALHWLTKKAKLS